MKREDKELIKNLSASLHENDWFLKKRLKALNLLDTLDSPRIDRFDYQEWNHFEKINHWKENDQSSKDLNTSLSVDYIQKSSGELQKINPSKKIMVASFQELFQKNQTLFKEIYQKSAFLDFNDRFDAFNLAYLTSGTFIYIPAGVQVKDPIQFAFLNEEWGPNNTNHQVYIYAEENTAVEIIENYSSYGEHRKLSKVNIRVHIETARGANVKYTAMDEFDEYTQAFFRRSGQLGQDTTLNLALGMMSNGKVIEDLQVDLIGDGSAADLKTVAISQKHQKQVANTKVINHGAHTVGNIYQHGVALDEAVLTFNGVGDVQKDAKHSDAQQESRILMLSEDARADTNPILLIDEYELTAGHAASISRVDEKQLYYLMSRGLGRKDAEKLVIRGFLGSVLSAISVEAVRNHLVETIERKLTLL
ncbi:MAG: Fe-S cluster assembly protein SufD [Atopostipes sp.]|nr:Fe-S cluster assembly protein SufD [Atopostipes sp.]